MKKVKDHLRNGKPVRGYSARGKKKKMGLYKGGSLQAYNTKVREGKDDEISTQ